MVILHIAYLTGNKSAGPNLTVPKNVEYGSLFEKCALLNCSDYKSRELNEKINCFSLKDYKEIYNLPKPYNNPDIVVFHSMYIKEFIKIYYEIKKRGIPYIIVPRGALTTKAQNKKKLKKILGNLVFFKKFVKNAASINFLTENEYRESKKFKINNFYVNGNGIESHHNIKKFQKNDGHFNVTFIGRIEWYHKGLDRLIEAINIGKDDFRKRKFIFNLYGPDDFNSYEKLNKMIDNYKIGDLIKINDSIFDQEKEKVLLKTDLFIHTSRLEGQPNSVIEAISYGIPVFVTPGTNIDSVVKENNLGFVSEFDEKKIKEKLIIAYNSWKNFPLIGKKEIEYSKKNFDWEIIIQRNIKEYNKIISSGD